jgi:hypothetical protein
MRKMTNEHGYNSLTGRSAIADVQTLVRRPPKSVPRQPPTPPYRVWRGAAVARAHPACRLHGWVVCEIFQIREQMCEIIILLRNLWDEANVRNQPVLAENTRNVPVMLRRGEISFGQRPCFSCFPMFLALWSLVQLTCGTGSPTSFPSEDV